ncbi:WD40/YVTN/BNR-like repeat-containing protein [Paenibacillus humicola]|uniref:WD40/YVTN/BNR-like repeat-containing protein n=1 Tax=Paenibacillus humicola TaxID=3110540 RepID=UPI00237A3249|nr:hypothetical protein [Paenibacillus humicola]
MKKWANLALAVLLSGALLGGVSYMPGQASADTAVTAGCRADDNGLDLKTVADTGNPHFQSVQFLSVNIGRAAGNGFMLGTSDAGCHWQAINNEGKYVFTQMQFLTNKLGYVLVQTDPTKPVNTLLRTADGGSTYKWIPTGNHPFGRVRFFTQETGFGYTWNGAYKTTNGGQTWTKVQTPANTRYTQFITPTKGWAVVFLVGGGYQVQKTTDGGLHWTNTLTVKAEDSFGGSIYGTDSEDVWVVLLGGSGMTQTSYSVFHTTNAGASWQQVISNPTAGGGPAPGPKAKAGTLVGPTGRPDDMQVFGRSAAFLAAGSPGYEQTFFGHSVDDGKTWTNLSSVTGSDAKISFTSPNNGYLAVTDSLYPSVFGTTDGGKTWTKKFSLPTTP